jgi:hypothetical protein
VVMVVGSIYWGASFGSADKLAAYKPVWLLVMEAKTGPERVAAVALMELDRRYRAGQIGYAEARELYESALQMGTTAGVEVDPRWGRIVEMGAWSGFVKEEESLKFVNETTRFDLRVPARVRQGEEFPVEIVVDGPQWSEGNLQLMMRLGSEGPGTNSTVLLGRFEPRRLAGSWTVESGELGPREISVPLAFSWSGQAWLTRQVRKDTIVVGAGEEVLDVVRDDGFAARAGKTWHCKMHNLLRRPGRAIYADIHFKDDAATMDAMCAFEVLIRWDAAGEEREVVVGEWTFFPKRQSPDNHRAASQTFERRGDLVFPDRVKEVWLVLRSSRVVAEKWARLDKVWLGPDIQFGPFRLEER